MKRLLEGAIDRPLPVFLAALVAVVLGLWCLARLPINRTPKIEIPYTLVIGTYEGAAPESVESEVTLELEERLNTLDDLRHITSVSREGVSTHILEFEDRADMTESLRDARDEADLAQVEFPDEAGSAVVRELSFDDEPIVFFTLTGADSYRLREIAEDLEPTLEAVEGVSTVEIFGGYQREVRVEADPRVLARHGLTLLDLTDRIRQQSRSIPAGELRSGQSQTRIRGTGEFQSLEEIRSIVVASEPAGSLVLADVATIEVGHERLTTGSWWNGEPSVTLIVRRRPDVNVLRTVERLHARVDALRAELPPGVRIETSSDASKDIATMILQLGSSAGFGIVLVVAVLFAMFGARQALLVSSALPFALLFTVIGLFVLGMEVSNVALFALILVLGLVVDGAIIVAEAIQAEREGGLRAREASKAGIGRVGLPVISGDLTTIAAFAPMLLMVGVMGQFMSVMPKVVILALIGSVFVDHLLLPAATARLPRRQAGRATPLAPDGLPWFSPELPRVRRLYLHALEIALRRRGAVCATAAGSFVVALLLFAGVIQSIFLPGVDAGRFTVNYELPLGTSLEETNRVGLLLGRHVEALPEVRSFVLTTGDTGALNTSGQEGGGVGPQHGRLTVELFDAAERERSQSQVITDLRERTAGLAGVEIRMRGREEGPPTGAALAVRIRGEDLDELAALAEAVEGRVAALPGARDVRVDYDRGNPEIVVDLDRPRASAQFGISPDRVSHALLGAFHGIEVGRMWLAGERVDLRVRAPESYAHTTDHVRELPIRTRDGSLVPIAEVAAVELSFSQDAIYRYDALRAVTVRADTDEGYSSVALEADARAALEALPLPLGVDLQFGGETEERDRSYASLWSALAWGALLIYVVIALQFNSILQPVIVLLTVPLSIIGVAIGLLVTGTPFSFLVFIGVVSLTGIVVNSGILMVDTINRKRRAGMPLQDAIRAASVERLRPVLLTTVTTIAGLLPLTLNVSSGGEFWVPLGTTIIAGLLVASLLTLFVVPVLYSLLEDSRRGWIFEWVREQWVAEKPRREREVATPAGGLLDPP